MKIHSIEQIRPKASTYFICKSLGFQIPPVLLTFKDAHGRIRREVLPLR